METGTLDILHVDMDAFFAAVEQRDRPELRGLPVIVGGAPDARGVVSSASYEARRHGVRSAMPTAAALARCPRAFFLKPDIEKYRRVSEQIKEIFYEYTPLVEPLSLDEAFLDVSGRGGGITIATEIKRRIRRELALTASVGVSYNKFLAKLGSGMNKPNGFTVITRSKAAEILPALPVRKLWGVGPKLEELLHSLGLYTAGDLVASGADFLRQHLGARGTELVLLARGIDDSPVEPPGLPKSVGEETTFKYDVDDIETLRNQARGFCADVLGRLRQHRLRFRTVTLKVRFNNFVTITRSHSIPHATDAADVLWRVCLDLFERVDWHRPVRLLGLSVSNLEPAAVPHQLGLVPLLEPGGGLEVSPRSPLGTAQADSGEAEA